MTVAEIEQRLQRIRDVVDDMELAHSREADLYEDVLQAIADGTCNDHRACAAAALKAIDINFPRCYA